MSKFVKNKVAILALSAIIVSGFALAFYYKNKKESVYEKVKVVALDEAALDFDAEVKPEKDIYISSELPKKILKVYVKEGQRVYPGKLLAQLENSSELANLKSAEANLMVAQAELEKARAGAREEDLEAAQKAMESAKANLELAQLNLKNATLSFFGRLDSYINKLEYYIVDKSTDVNNDKFIYQVDEKDAQQFIKQYQNIKKQYNALKLKVKELSYSSDESIGNLAYLTTNLARNMRDLVLAMQIAAENKINEQPVTKPRLESVRDELRVLRADLDKEVSLLDNKYSAYEAAIPAFKQAVANYEKVKSGTRKEDIKALEAKLNSAKATLQAARSAYRKTFIYSPLPGLVVEKYKDSGEFVRAGEPILKINSSGKYIEILIPENDMSRISVGDKFKVVLDSYKDQPFFAVLKFIYPDKIEKGGVVYYRAKLYPAEKELKIKNLLPGMTGSAYLQLKASTEVSFPAKFLLKDNSGRQYVLLSKKEGGKEKIIKKYIKAKVESGMAYTDDLKEGETLLLPKK